MFPQGRVPNQDSEALFTAVASVLSDTSARVAENTEFLLGNMCEQTLRTYAELLFERNAATELQT